VGRAADNTIDFVKQWVYGLYTKRQYQNWYIVKTEHSEFLLTLTDKRELYAIKDRKSGHVFVWDDQVDLGGTTGNEDPFVCMIREGFVFPAGHTRLHPLSDNYYQKPSEALKFAPNSLRNHLSKWRLCERIQFEADKYGNKCSISLIAMGDRRFFTMPFGGRNAMKTIPLDVWASFRWESTFDLNGNFAHYKLTECPRPGIEKVAEIRGHFLELAGDRVAETRVVENGMIYYPTNAKTLDDLAESAFLEARTSRPNPFHYNISPSISDYSKLSRRHETIAENGEFLKECLSLDGDKTKDFHSTNWKEHLHKFLPNDLAENYIAYFNADDAWLEQHRDVARASYLEYALRSNSIPVSGWIYVVPNDDVRFGPQAIYVRAEEGPFKRLVPTPSYHNKVFTGLLTGEKRDNEDL
jgi:hypothetical protein